MRANKIRVKNMVPIFQGYCSFGDEKTGPGPVPSRVFFVLGPEIFGPKLGQPREIQNQGRVWVVFIYVPPVFFISYFFTGSCNISSAELPYVKQIAHFFMSKHLGHFPKIFCNLFYLHEKNGSKSKLYLPFQSKPEFAKFW